MAVIAKQRYKLDIAPKGGWVIVYASQHDDGAREIEFEITNQGNAFSIPASINVSVQGIKANKSYFSHSCSYSGNIVTMALDDDMTDVIGKAICVLKFTNSSQQKLATAKFILNVDSDSSSEGIIIDTEAEEIFNQMLNEIRAQASAISVDIAELQSMVGSPLVASTASGMTDHNKIYVYTGSESGYTNGNWYYWDGSAWTSGGVYNSNAFSLDTNIINPTVAIIDKKYVKYDNGTIYDSNSYCYLEANNINTYRRLHVHTNITGAVGICFYDVNDIFISGIKNESNTSPYLFDEDVDVPDGAYIIRVSCLRTYNATLSINTTFKTMLDGVNDAIDDNKLDADERIGGIKKLDSDLFVSSEMWEMGGVNGTNGALVTSNAYIRTGYIDVTSYKKINVVPNEGYRYAFAFYDTNKSPVGYSGAATNPKNALPRNVDIPLNAVYFLIAVGNTSGTTANLDYANEITITGIYILLDSINALNDALGIDDGNTKYTGDKIVLTESTQRVYNCTINQWLDFSGGGTLADYLLHLNQSMAIYNDYMFLFQDGGTVTVLDYETKETVGMYTTPITDANHQNGAQFSNIFYDDNDEFPLLFVSRASTMPNNECLVYRVQRNNTTFTFTLVNTLNVTPVIFQPTWGIDNRRNVITALAYTSANYGVETNNFIKVRTWPMPTKTEILSGNPITVNISDALLEIGLPYAAYQQCIMYNGDIFLCYQPRTGGRLIYRFDGFSGMLLSTVAMPDTVSEMEGLYVYNGKMYVTQKRGTDTEANNPLTIYEITF